VLFELDVGNDKLDVGVAIISIELRLIGDVKELIIEQLLLKFSEPKADTPDRGLIVGYGKL